MKVHQLYTYPIKSLRGVSIPSAELTPQGFSHDRRFMLLRDHGDAAKAPKGERYENLHVAYHPEMCLFTTALLFADPNDRSDGEIEVTHTSPEDKSTKTLRIPLKPDISHLTPIDICMHQSPIKALAMPNHYCDWFSAIFGFPVVLAWLGSRYRTVLGNLAPNAATRNPILQKQHEAKSATPPTDPPASTSWLSSFANRMPGLPTIFNPGNDEDDDTKQAPSSPSEDYTITFADCSPYLITSTTSLSNVSSRLPAGQEMDITKFRPNILVSGAAEPYEEDFWRELAIGGDVTVLLTSNCVRCSSINVDYATGKFGADEGGQVLKKLQSDRRVDKGHKYGPVFGRYGFLTRRDAGVEGEGDGGGVAGSGGLVVRVGDEVEVLRRNEERTTFRWPGIGQTPKTDLYAL